MPDSFQPDSFVPDEKTARSQPPPLVRSRTGTLYQPPTESGVGDMLQGAGEAINPMTYLNLLQRAATDPMGTAGDVLLSPVRLVGDLLNHPAHAIGNVAGGIALGGAVSGAKAAAGSAVRGAAGVADTVGPDAVGVFSPRAGNALRVAQKVRDRMAPQKPSAPEAPATPAASAPPSAAPETPATAPSTPAPPAGPAAAPPSSLKAAAAAEKLKLSPKEFEAFRDLVQQGYDPDKVLKAIQGQRAASTLQQRLGTPTNAEVDATVADRNATGRWPQDRH